MRPATEDGQTTNGLAVGTAASPPLSRMGIALLSLIGLLIAIYLTLYKIGYLGFVACGDGGCETVQASSYADLLGMPVAMWGVGAYALLLGLSLVGLQPRWVASRTIALGIFGVAAIGVAFSAYLTYLEAVVINAWCRWCVVSAVLIVLIFILSLPGFRYTRSPGEAPTTP